MGRLEGVGCADHATFVFSLEHSVDFGVICEMFGGLDVAWRLSFAASYAGSSQWAIDTEFNP